MNELQETAPSADQAPSDAALRPRYTRNNPYHSTVLVNRLLSGEGSEKETRHFAFSLEDGITYTPGDAVGVVPENRAEVVDEVLYTLGFTGEEPVLDHYKNQISFAEALRTWLAIGKLGARTVSQYAKLPAAAGVGGRGQRRSSGSAARRTSARRRVLLGRESSIITDFRRHRHPQELFNVLPASRRASTPSPPARPSIPIPSN